MNAKRKGTLLNKNRLRIFRFAFSFICVFLAAAVNPNRLLAQKNSSIISIDNAESTEYRKNPDSGNEEIILSGSVILSVTSGKSKTTISASRVTYDRVTEMLFASGNVTLRQTGGSEGGQDVTAQTLLFNARTMEGIFDGGRVVQTKSDAINLPSDSTLIVSSKIFGRDTSGTIAFKNAELTFCDDEKPHWKIWASNIWLLPGGEFAFFNAVLSVGNIPIFYLPAFYYPKDELVFNPSFGYNERTGYFFQTTTYILGRKPLDTSSDSDAEDDITKGLFNFMKSTSLKKQVREGLVLHNLDEDYKGNTDNYLKIMGDYYTNLGIMAGIQGAYKPKKYISGIEGFVKLGFTNTINSTSGGYTPYFESGKTYSDSSNFMGLELPFRYGASFKLSMSKPFSLTLSLPVYSDPYFTEDFDERSEYIDWLGFLMSGAGQTKEENDKSSQTSSFTWNATGSYTVPLPDAVKPFINSLSLSGINSSVAFSSKTRNSSDDPEFYSRENKNYSPERSFYYPSQVTPFKISSKISGTIIQYPPSVKKAKSAEKIKFDIPLVAPEIISVPQNKSSKKESDASSTEGGSAENTERTAALAEQADGKEEKASEETVLSEKDLPLLEPSQKHSLVTLGGLKYTLGYSINPQYTSQLSYNSSDLKKPGDFSWSNLYSSYYQVKVPSTLTSSFSYGGSFASMTNTLSFNPVYQEHPNLDGYTESSASSVRKTDYNARKLDLTGTNSVSFNPFAYSTVFKNTGLNWNTTVKVLRTEFLGDETNPEWDYITSDLTDSDSVTAHTLSATLSAVEDKFSQVLTLSTTLPPQVDEYDASLKLTFPFLSLSFSSGVEQKSKDDETFVLKPFKQSASLKLFDSTLSLTESFNYELEDDYADALKIALSWNNLQLAYTMQYTNGYEPKKDDSGKLTDWEMKTDKEFIPYSASLAYSTKSKTYRYWKNRITWAPSLSTSIVYDCLRPTNSYFRFAPSISFKINEFFELSFTSESRNSVIFRYFQDYIGYEDTIGGEKNPFVDLWNSFVFWSDDAFFDPDQTVRKSSGFKIKNLKISITHKLCDWDMSASLTFKPRAVTGDDNKKSYDYHPYFTFGVTWRPMASMKTQIVDEYGEWKLNP